MRTFSFNRRSSFGEDCVRCGNYLIAPNMSGYREGLHVVHFWHCPNCDCSFEVIFPADIKSIKDIMRRIEHAMRRSEPSPMSRVA